MVFELQRDFVINWWKLRSCNGTLDVDIIIGATQFVYIDTYIYVASAFRVKVLIKKFCNLLAAKTTVWQAFCLQYLHVSFWQHQEIKMQVTPKNNADQCVQLQFLWFEDDAEKSREFWKTVRIHLKTVECASS